MEPTTQDNTQLQVLSLDGGGLKGIFAAATLAAWEEDFDTRIGDHFDLVVGTSTGGLLALGLGLGHRPAELLDLYLTRHREIFPPRRGPLRGLRTPRYEPDGLRAVLEEQFGDAVLGHSQLRLAIPAYDLTADHVHLFRTPHHPELRRDWRVRAVDVAMATTAAPTYLPATTVEHHRLIDGGVWANNPTMVGVAECFDRLGGDRGGVRVLNVGTTTELRNRPTSLDRGGLLAWRRAGLDIVLRGQTLAATSHAALIVGRSNVIRVDAAIAEGTQSLDRVTATELIGRAHAESRNRSPELGEMFAHTPAPYEPFHTQEKAHV